MPMGKSGYGVPSMNFGHSLQILYQLPMVLEAAPEIEPFASLVKSPHELESILLLTSHALDQRSKI
jgi:hypothetical protein